MTEKRTSGLRVKSIDFNNESNILIENVDKSIDATGAHMDSQEVLIDSSPQEVKQFLEEIVGNTNLRTFKEKYQQKYNTLKSSYEKEVKTLR